MPTESVTTVACIRAAVASAPRASIHPRDVTPGWRTMTMARGIPSPDASSTTRPRTITGPVRAAESEVAAAVPPPAPPAGREGPASRSVAIHTRTARSSTAATPATTPTSVLVSLSTLLLDVEGLHDDRHLTLFAHVLRAVDALGEIAGEHDDQDAVRVADRDGQRPAVELDRPAGGVDPRLEEEPGRFDAVDRGRLVGHL